MQWCVIHLPNLRIEWGEEGDVYGDGDENIDEDEDGDGDGVGDGDENIIWVKFIPEPEYFSFFVSNI